MRIQKSHYYVLRTHPGISGFMQWDKWVESVVTGHKAANNRCSVNREYLANGLSKFRLGDGHLPECQPIAAEVDALRWLDANPYQEIIETTLGVEPFTALYDKRRQQDSE